MDAVVAADAGGAVDYHVRADHGALRNLHARPYHAERTDADPVCDLRIRVNACAGMNHGASRSAHRISALATSLPSTRSEEHTSELQSLMPSSSAVFCLQKK